MVHLESLDESEIWPKFLNVTKCFCDHVFTTSKVKTVKGGYSLTGRRFGHLVQSYVSTISSGKVPCLENAVVAMARIENQAALAEGIKLYQSEMEQVKSLFPMSLSDFSAKHQEISNMATGEFMKRSFKDEEQKYFKKLMDAVDKHHADLIAQNMEASEEKCEKILSDLYEQMNVCVQNREYAKPGGYNLYCKHRDNVINQYHAQPNKGIQAEEVLERFLKGKNAEAKLILQTDEQLTESEKKIQEEKEQASLLEQKYKVEHERKMEMELLMQEEKVHNEQRLKQLERKFEEEKIQQQQEMGRALENKLKEQKELVEKGFEEKAQLMQQEIEHLKRQKDDQSGCVFKDYIMPLVDTAKDVFSIFLQYDLTRKGF